MSSKTNGEKNQPSVSDIVSPQYMSVCMNYEPPTTFKEEYSNSEIFQCNSQNTFNQSGAKPKIHNDQQHQKLVYIQNRFPRFQEDVEEPGEGNQHERNLCCETPFKTPVFQQKSSLNFPTDNHQIKWDISTQNTNPNKFCSRKNFKQNHSKNVKRTKRNFKNPSINKITPLLSFHIENIASEKSFDMIPYSDDDDDDDDSCSISQHSVDTANLIEFSDDESDSNVTEESNLTSEISITSSPLDSETRLNNFQPLAPKKESFVSVFWDVEDCALPPDKSIVAFATYIRGTFYEGRTEVTFTAVCHFSKLNAALLRDLHEAGITLVHRKSQNRHATEKTIMSSLQKFQNQYQKSDSAIVLISNNSDYSQIILDMHFQYHIFVNLICKSSAQDSLIFAANKYVPFEDILNHLPDQVIEKNDQHVLTLANLPKMKLKIIKNILAEKLTNFNCKLKFVNTSLVKIYFKEYCDCVKAMTALKGLYLDGNVVNISYQIEDKGNKNVIPKKEKSKHEIPLDVNVKEIDLSEHNIIESGKAATLCVVVSMCLRDAEYWKIIFENIWNMTDFLIEWDDNTFGGCFLISFKSLKKAQKAKKILQKNQMNDPGSPKFLKLIKHGEDFDNLKMPGVKEIQTINKQKVGECFQIIEKKTLEFLKKHENIMNEIKYQAVSEISGACEAVNDKLKEYQEQMQTFINFSNRARNAIKSLNYDSEDLDDQLKEILCDFIRECNCITSALPIYAKKEIILKKIIENQVIVIRAETGSGKSTQLTQYIWRESINLQKGMIICTQPRKIAAISLAKHVSSQIGCSLGDIVGYQVGMSNKMSPNTKILYVTDFTMLKILVSENLDSISCIIIDEAHERTIYTDILLGMIKQYLPIHPHLRVVITSATIDTSLFRDFFLLTDSAVLQVSGRTFPVQDEWLNSDIMPTSDYFSKTIDKAFEILKEEPGDVLSFLVTPLETEKAVERFTQKLKTSKLEKSVKVFCLHGKMNSEEQQKVFQNLPQGIRKVVFATNCAETSITIPGIKYVIDCGLAKESKYDAIRNMNILNVGFISRSSAEQRRGRAGRTQVGKCYRLYSKENYKCMESSAVPEILRINLGQAILKLLKIGVKNPLQFDFIQSPPKELLTSAMNQLLYLNAVDENFTLTDLGKNMAALPLEPRLCHLIFHGFDNNIGYDTLVTAALVTMSQAIFYRNSENMDEADKKKKRFCDYENDFITYLEVYKEWVDVPKSSKSQWCVINCINARSMRIVHDLVNEIILILQNELNFVVKLKFNSEAETYDTLTKIIFYSFSQNLSVFSGHTKFGYMNLNITEQLYVHPSSSLSAFRQLLPQFVVYDTILKTARTYIVNVCPVKREMILDIISFYCLKIDLKSLEDLTCSTFGICPVGEKIIVNHFIGKKGTRRKEVLKRIKELTKSELIEMDTDVSKGCIKIFSLPHHFDEIKSLVHPIINNAKQSFLNEERYVDLFEDNHFTVALAAGGRINDAVLPGEFRDIKVILNGQESIESVSEKLSLCGTIISTREWKRYFKVTFDTSASAKKALDTYSNETEFSLRRISNYSYVNERDYLYKVFMKFCRRPCLGVAFITVEPKMSLFLLPSWLDIKDHGFAKMSISKKSQDIRITDLPPNTDKKELESLVSKILPADTKITKCVITRKKSYESAKEEMDSIKRNILELFSAFTFKENITVSLKKPTANDFYWNATIFFKNSLDGEAAVSALKSHKNISNFVGGFVFKPHLETFLCCKTQIFSVVKEEIEEALEFFKKNQSVGNLLDIKVVPKNSDTVEVKIMSNNICDITDARRCISAILGGDELKFASSSHQIQLFSNSGKELMKELSEKFEKDCYIYQDEYNKTVIIYGKQTSCNIIKMCINEFLVDVKDDELKELSLKTNSGKTGVLKELLKTYGYDLQKLKEDCGISNIEINKYKQLIIIQGNLLSITKCESLIQVIKEKLDASSSEAKGEICPVCWDEVSENKHRLEYCGHAYCVECLLHLFESSENIPLNCESCHDPIVLVDIFWAISGRKELKKKLFRKLLHSFVDSQSDISFCSSPDCTMIFRVTKDKMNIFKCPSCGNSICTSCKDVYHSGMTCSLNKCLKESKVFLETWKKDDPVNHKTCPSCSSPIEKNGGCNHMTCWKCNCHMCWLCLQVFPTGREVYLHQPLCPVNSQTKS